MSYSLSSNGLAFIKSFEGCRLTSYQDEDGTWTIGYGTIVYSSGLPVLEGQRITQQQADSELYFQVTQKTKLLQPLITSVLTSNQYDSVCDFSYNEGVGAFQNSTLRKLINADPTDPNITNAFLMWVDIRIDGVLTPSAGLKRRRLAEADLYFD